jgi:hypothetical protein
MAATGGGHNLWVDRRFLFVLMALGLLGALSRAEAQNPHQVPVVDAEAGPCSVEMTVTDFAGKPVYAATIRVHISHGFLGTSKTDLQIGTNVDGKARFVGLPENLDEGLYFRAAKGRSKGTAFYNPAKKCHAKHFIVLHKRR